MNVVQILSVKLQRADQSVSWGFNIQGGRDQNSPLLIIKVNPESLADRCSMRPGDYIIKIGNTSTEFLTNNDCRETIIRQGNDLNLTLFRGAIPRHEDYASCFQFPQPQLMNSHVPMPMAKPALSPQVGVQLSSNKALLTQSYNSPVGLYSNKNIADSMTAAIKSFPKEDSAESSSEMGRDLPNGFDSASLTTNTINSISSSSSSASVSPTTVQNTISAAAKVFDNLALQDNCRPGSPRSVASTNSFNPVPKPFYKREPASELQVRPESPLVRKTAEIISGENSKPRLAKEPLIASSGLVTKLQGLDFKVLEENPAPKPFKAKLSNETMQVNDKLQNLDFKIIQEPSVSVSAPIHPVSVSPIDYDDIDRETEETFRKYREVGANFKRESFTAQRQTVSMDANNNETKSAEPLPLEKILAERRQSELVAQELAVRLNQSPSRSPSYMINGRLAKSKSIAVDNQSYYDLNNFKKSSPKLNHQPTIQDSYLSQLNNQNKNNYSINKTVSPSYKPFSNQYPTPSYLEKEAAKINEATKSPNNRSYVGKLDDHRRPSMTQSRTFELLRKTLDSELPEGEMVTYNSITNKNEIRRCSLNTNINSPNGKSNPLAPTTLKKTTPSAGKTDDDTEDSNELRDEFMKSKYGQIRSASIASSSPSTMKDLGDLRVNKNTPYYQHYKKIVQEVEEEKDTDGTKGTLDDDDSSAHQEALNKFMERRKNNGNYRSLSLNDSNVVPFSGRKYSALVTGIREDDETNES